MSEPFYDVFISHAYEDQNEFVGQLALALKKQGLKVWYSGFELKLGASIASSVNDALKNSKHGIVIMSPIYLTKRWAMKELEALIATDVSANNLLPVLHGISVETLREKMPLLADKYAVSSRRGMDFVVNKILHAINGNPSPGKNVRKRKKVVRSAVRKAQTSIQNAGVIVLGGKADVKNAAGGDIIIRKSRK